MSAPAEVRPYSAGDKPALLDILERVYDGAARRRYELMWDWWQNRNILAADACYRPAVVHREGRVVGFAGLQPRRFKIGSQTVEGGFILDNFSSPEARGVGITLLRRLIEGTELILGAPVPRAGELWRKLFGKHDIEVFHVRKGVRVIDPAAFLPARAQALLRHPARWLWACAMAVLSACTPRLRGPAVEQVGRFPAAVDALCARWASTRVNCALRDADYLNWRFSDSPIAYEKVLLWQGASLAGLAAYRVGYMNGRKVLLLVEMLAGHANPAGVYGALLAHVVRHAKRNGAADVQTFDTGCPDMRRALRRNGFFLKPESLAVIGHFRHDKSAGCPIYRTQDWFMSAGDSDFEFAYFNQGWESLEATFV